MAKKKTKAGKAISGVKFAAIVLVICVAGYLCISGFGQGFMVQYMKPWAQAISLGLDLRGGVYTVYQAKDDGEGSFSGKLDSTITILGGRLTRQGFTEATVSRQGADRIRIEIPDVNDPNEILNIIGTPAHLTFTDPSGNVVLEGAHVKSADLSYDQNGMPAVSFKLDDEGAKLFAEATAANLGRSISIKLDGETISSPTVQSVIAGGEGQITSSGMTVEDANNLAMLIQSGALPLDIEQIEVSAISATLGVEALERALLAGFVGVILVMLFMLLRYRLCGLVADIALTGYIITVIFLLAITGAQLTLPGVAGIVLGIGMAVDANVIIYERIREEVKLGRPINSAIGKGFNNALSAIIDSNITTIIASLVLYMFGTGSIRGFALTLGIGVVTSMVFAVFVTKTLLNLTVDICGQNEKLYVR